MLGSLLKYGALSAKTRAMYGKRVTPEDFRRMSAMRSVPQVAAFLKNQPSWARVLADIDDSKIHRGQFEVYLRDGFLAEYSRIMHFIQGEDAALMRYPILLSEIGQVMTFIRHLNAGKLQSYHPSVPSFVADKYNIDFEALARAENYGQMLEAVKRCEFAAVLPRFAPPDGSKVDYTAAETALDSFYYVKLFDLSKKRMRGVREEKIGESFGMTADISNIIRIIRLKRHFTVDPENLFTYVIPVFYKIRPEFLHALARTPDSETALAMIDQTRYKNLFRGQSFMYLEQYLDRFIYEYNRKLLFEPQPSILMAIAYLNLKQLEIKNLIHTIECVRYSIPPEKQPAYLAGMEQPGGQGEQ